ncbi:sensor domain-containing diguanylate cyclase [Gloeocapsa sp. PCC 73106]|uniref:GGDEF domain-containing protein n=1 Tax=Gloeocapsa sp. PCC 73106 TaxID=102232 RepID=UPI0002AC3CC8|nr:sensor domain-containing diguanylate cyclase [Gloeocapsa sp. PCC 73106]ELR99830.1 diguanylate cyclase (GGDEF) domain-containing protein [Gloeocapsa sp. PCC 73106]
MYQKEKNKVMEMPLITPFSSFETSVQSVLDFLHQRLGFQLWMFTRVEQEDWIVLAASDHGYGVKPGDVFHWSDSFCSRMVNGLGPRIAPNSQEIAAYLEAPIGKIVPISAYIGIPLCHRDGSLFGTLCAIDPMPQSEIIRKEGVFVELQTKLLTTILHYELEAQNNARLYERAQKEAEMDWLPGVYNSKGWHRLLEAEEIRCQRFGQPASVIIIDLDNLKVINDQYGHDAGDRLLKATGQCLLKSVRDHDIVARFGGDEFGILLLDITESETEAIVHRIETRLRANQILASLGWAKRSPLSDLFQTAKIADQRMYEQKMQHKLIQKI